MSSHRATLCQAVSGQDRQEPVRRTRMEPHPTRHLAEAELSTNGPQVEQDSQRLLDRLDGGRRSGPENATRSHGRRLYRRARAPGFAFRVVRLVIPRTMSSRGNFVSTSHPDSVTRTVSLKATSVLPSYQRLESRWNVMLAWSTVGSPCFIDWVRPSPQSGGNPIPTE